MDYRTHEIGQFLDAIASARVAPAGGSAAAVTGAFGAALAEMAIVHTNEQNGGPENDDLTQAQDRLRGERDVLVSLASEDAAAIDALFANRTEKLDGAAVSRATGIPLSIAEACVTVLEETLAIADQVADSVRQDLHTALYLSAGAAWAAIRTVEPNLELLEDPEIRKELQTRVDTILERFDDAKERVAETTGMDRFDC